METALGHAGTRLETPDLVFPIDRIPYEGQVFLHRFGKGWAVDLLVSGYTGVLSAPEVEGIIKPSGNTYLVEGELKGAFKAECVRCLEAFSISVEGLFTHVFDPSISSDDDGNDSESSAVGITPLTNEQICLEPMLAEELVLLVPAYPVCSKACQGLCAQCGVNLNTEECHCTPILDPRWTKLRELKLDDGIED